MCACKSWSLEEMNEKEAIEILKDALREDNSLLCVGTYIEWPLLGNINAVCLDGGFSIKELEAIVWWSKNKEIIR